MTEDFCFLLLPEFSSIGFMSAIEPLRVANRFNGALYRWHILSTDGGPVAASNGISLNAEGALDTVKNASAVFVVAGFEPLACYTREIGDWLRRLDRAGVTLGGIDTGSFLLAEAGLLEHKRATVHWEAASAFKERYPSLEVSQELFEIDERRITCAGGTASIDLMLDVIARRHGAELAAQVSEQFVLGRIRQRSDHQRMEIAARYGIHNRKLIQVIGVMEQHMEEPLSPDELAESIGVTRRQLERLFCSALEGYADAFLSRPAPHARARIAATDRHVDHGGVRCVRLRIAVAFFAHVSTRFGTSPRHDRSALRTSASAQTLEADAANSV